MYCLTTTNFLRGGGESLLSAGFRAKCVLVLQAEAVRCGRSDSAELCAMLANLLHSASPSALRSDATYLKACLHQAQDQHRHSAAHFHLQVVHVLGSLTGQGNASITRSTNCKASPGPTPLTTYSSAPSPGRITPQGTPRASALAGSKECASSPYVAVSPAAARSRTGQQASGGQGPAHASLANAAESGQCDVASGSDQQAMNYGQGSVPLPLSGSARSGSSQAAGPTLPVLFKAGDRTASMGMADALACLNAGSGVAADAKLQAVLALRCMLDAQPTILLEVCFDLTKKHVRHKNAVP